MEEAKFDITVDLRKKLVEFQCQACSSKTREYLDTGMVLVVTCPKCNSKKEYPKKSKNSSQKHPLRWLFSDSNSSK